MGERQVSPVSSRLGGFALVLACGLGGSFACGSHDLIDEGFGGGPGLRSGAGVEQAPFFGATVTLAHKPPPISGGTLLMLANGTTAVAADPDRDQLYVVDLAGRKLTATIPLTADDEPGRLIEDAHGRVHVSLRGGGAVATLDLATNRLVDRRAVCPAPRGIAYDASTDDLYIACNGGELVTLPAGGGAPTRSLFLATDLRDIVVRFGQLFVSRFRQADVLEVDPTGTVVRSFRPPVSSSGTEPDVAWRMISAPSSSAPSTPELAMVHQRARRSPVSVAPGGYGESSGCPETSIVETTVTAFTGNWPSANTPAVPAAVLPVDFAASPDGTTFAVVAAGNAKTPSLPSVFFVARSSEGQLATGSRSGCGSVARSASVPGQVTAVAFASNTQAWVQTREPAALWLLDESKAPGAEGPYLDVVASVVLSADSREDTGHSIVHSNAGAFIACASCHAEGGEDGRVWRFQSTGGQSTGGLTPSRRTQSLRGTLDGTAPYHWEGDMQDIPTLAHEVFVQRMGGPALATDQAAALQSWLFALPRPRTSPVDPASAARGAALFTSTEVGCSHCHSGPLFTNNLTLDVGTGGRFQVPSLIGVSWRAPYLHDGRAPELVDRFNSKLAGDLHGNTSQLTTPQVDDLVAYLSTL
jgi:hypothetical protein